MRNAAPNGKVCSLSIKPHCASWLTMRDWSIMTVDPVLFSIDGSVRDAHRQDDGVDDITALLADTCARRLMKQFLHRAYSCDVYCECFRLPAAKETLREVCRQFWLRGLVEGDGGGGSIMWAQLPRLAVDHMLTSLEHCIPLECVRIAFQIHNGERLSVDIQMRGAAMSFIQHWTRMFDLDHGAPAAAYETTFFHLHSLVGTNIDAAARACSVAKGIAWLFFEIETQHRRGSSYASRGSFLSLAATALDVSMGRLAALLCAVKDVDDAHSLAMWVTQRWIHFVVYHVNVSLGVEGLRLSSCGEMADLFLTVAFGTAATKGFYLFGDENIPPHLDALLHEAFRGGTVSWVGCATPPVAGRELRSCGALNSLLCSVVIGDGRAARESIGPVLKWHFALTGREFLRLFEPVIPFLKRCRWFCDDFRGLDVDADEADQPSIFSTDEGLVPTIFKHVKQCSLLNRIRLYLISFRWSFREESHALLSQYREETEGDKCCDGRSEQSVSGPDVDCVVDPTTGLTTILKPSHFGYALAMRDAALKRFHILTLQGFCRCINAKRRVLARRSKRIGESVIVVQRFLRSLASMRIVNVLDCRVVLRRLPMSETRVSSMSNTSTYLMAPASSHVTTPLSISNANTRAITLALTDHVCRAEARYRNLVVQAEGVERGTAIWSYFTTNMPLMHTCVEEREARIEMFREWWVCFLDILACQETALRARVEFLQQRSLKTLRLRGIELQKWALFQEEATARVRNIEMPFYRTMEEMQENTALLQHMETLVDLDPYARQARRGSGVDAETPQRAVDPLHVTRPRSVTFAHNNPFSNGVAVDATNSDIPVPLDEDTLRMFASQRQRFLDRVTSTITRLLDEESSERKNMKSRLQFDEVLGREAAERAAVVRQSWLQWSRLRTAEPRARLGAEEQKERAQWYILSRCELDEMRHRMTFELQDILLRQTMLELQHAHRMQINESTKRWLDVCSDRYTSPSVVLAQLQREQASIKKLLSSMDEDDRRQRRTARSALRAPSESTRTPTPVSSTRGGFIQTTMKKPK